MPGEVKFTHGPDLFPTLLTGAFLRLFTPRGYLPIRGGFGKVLFWPDRARFLPAPNASHFDNTYAIVVQGPVMQPKSFTLQSLVHYRLLYPSVTLVLSTWTDQVNQRLLEALEIIRCHVVLPQRPENPGPSNINLQIVSSGSGIDFAGGLGAKFVLKTRSDQRLASGNFLNYFVDLLGQFPLHPAHSGSQSSRLVGLSRNTFVKRPYGLSDMLQFGHISDLKTFWNPALDARRFLDDDRHLEGLWEKGMRLPAETYITAEFLKATGWNLKWTPEDSNLSHAARFVVADATSVKLLWPKYSVFENLWALRDDVEEFDELDFPGWLRLYRHATDGQTLK